MVSRITNNVDFFRNFDKACFIKNNEGESLDHGVLLQIAIVLKSNF